MIQVGSRADIITAAFIVWPRVAQLTRAPGAVTGHILTQPCAAVTSSPQKYLMVTKISRVPQWQWHSARGGEHFGVMQVVT